ncbi:MAG TPA: hypothetical protein DHW15_07145, partial [Bacteroidetes bacterium]|nr:hypothetical protein [Bacteroidota bacterium]
GFEWTQLDRQDDCILCYERIAKDKDDFLLVVMNADQQTHYDYPVHVRPNLSYREIFSTDSEEWGGSGIHNAEPIAAVTADDDISEIRIMIPPLSLLIFKPEKK